jgi:ferredoxin--NADP+ reductase
MTQVGTTANPLRVAIVGAGPAGFYVVEHLFRQDNLTVEIDMFDRLPTPFGLVRAGVAPDHQKIKSVIKVYDRLARRPDFRFYGNVEFGRDITLADMKQLYHQICFTTGAQTDRPLGIPGEELENSFAATEFVAWYNGHPDFRDCRFDLSQENVAIVGVGNVAIDVARILCRTPEELAVTDIADHALAALRHSQIKRVYLLGRRGPAQAAFTTPEIKEVGELDGADVLVPPDEAKLDPLSQAELDKSQDRTTLRKVEILQEYARHQPTGKLRQLIIRFLVSPVELIGDAEGKVQAMRLVHNELYATPAGTLRPKATDQFETIPVELVFRSVGYRGVPLPDIPFNDDWGVILNQNGRILETDSRQSLPGLYTAGWIKRGPSGVIGTNKPDAAETVERMTQDLANGIHFQPIQPDVEAARRLIEARKPDYTSYQDWLRLDAIEVAHGQSQGRPRVKFTRVDEMLAAMKQAEGSRQP